MSAIRPFLALIGSTVRRSRLASEPNGEVAMVEADAQDETSRALLGAALGLDRPGRRALAGAGGPPTSTRSWWGRTGVFVIVSSRPGRSAASACQAAVDVLAMRAPRLSPAGWCIQWVCFDGAAPPPTRSVRRPLAAPPTRSSRCCSACQHVLERRRAGHRSGKRPVDDGGPWTHHGPRAFVDRAVSGAARRATPGDRTLAPLPPARRRHDRDGSVGRRAGWRPLAPATPRRRPGWARRSGWEVRRPDRRWSCLAEHVDGDGRGRTSYG